MPENGNEFDFNQIADLMSLFGDYGSLKQGWDLAQSTVDTENLPRNEFGAPKMLALHTALQFLTSEDANIQNGRKAAVSLLKKLINISAKQKT